MEERFAAAKRASIWGIIGNLFLFIIKAIIGFMSHSQAMIADSFNSGSDILSSIMTYIGNRISSKSADDDHNLGHGKAEYIYSMLISIMMMFLGGKLLLDAIKSFYRANNYVFNWWLIIVCLITIIIKFLLYIYTRRIGKQYNSLLVKANSKDHRNDTIITLCNLFSVLMAMNGVYIFDGIVGIGISLWIILTGGIIFRDSYDILMDKTISTETKDRVLEIINSYQEVLKVNHFNATPVGYRYQISFTIFVDGDLSTFESHGIANRLEKEIAVKIPEIYLSVIHVNPVKVKKVKSKKVSTKK